VTNVRVLVAGWVGSSNLGDELCFAGLRRQLAARGAEVAAVSTDPERTRRWHGTGAVDHRDLAGIVSAVRSADAMVFGGGGILQDVTSPLNLPYHLSRVVLARGLHTPFAGVGLGVGGVDTRLGAALIRHAMRGNLGITVRDAASRDLLTRVGVPGAQVAADLAFALEPPATPRAPREVIAVSLRPWSERISRLPAAAHVDGTPERHVAATAHALDEIAGRTGLQIRFVALQRDRDDAFHRRIAERMRTPTSFAAPELDGFLDAYADARAVISMRYHGGVGAVLAGCPVVLISYALKVDALALELGAGARRLGWDAADLARLPDALDAVIDQGERIQEAREDLRERQHRNGDLLDRLLETAAARR
jgi:polysaccharide pyruvyl transferase CsaB